MKLVRFKLYISVYISVSWGVESAPDLTVLKRFKLPGEVLPCYSKLFVEMN